MLAGMTVDSSRSVSILIAIVTDAVTLVAPSTGFVDRIWGVVY